MSSARLPGPSFRRRGEVRVPWHCAGSVPVDRMQLPDMRDLLMLDPRVSLMLIDQPRLDSRRARSLDVDRIDVAGELHFFWTDSEPFECDLKNPRVGFR